MPSPSPAEPGGSLRRKLLVIAGILLLALVVGWLLWGRSRTPPTARSATPAGGTPVAHVAAAGARMPDGRPVPPALRPDPPGKPIIDSITVEKPEVCEGEENLVTVKAHTPDHKDDAFLHYNIGTGTGSSVSIRSFLPSIDDRKPHEHKVVVFGRHNVSTEAKVPYFKVKDCRAGWLVNIEHRVLPNRPDDFEFHVKIVALDPKEKLEPVSYVWDFGDGQSTTTTEPLVTHSYEKRKQDTHFSQLLVRCTVVAKSGARVQGLLSLQLLNDLFENFNFKGVVVLRARLEPRFPELNANGVVEQQVFLWHNWPEAVTIEKVFRTAHGHWTPTGQRADKTEIALSEILASPVIPPAGVETTGRLDTTKEPDTVSHYYELQGRTNEGWPVGGTFSIMRPSDNPTRDKHVPVADPLLHAKILRAREILGQEFVTDEDLWRLEKLGHFADLKVDPNKSVKTLLPPPPPPKGRSLEDRGAAAPPR